MKPIFGAPEIIILVFQSCNNVEDSLSLASTCKFLASVWRAHAASILYPLVEAKTAGFNQALLAVRATKLVCDACQANEMPPRPFPLHELRVDVRKPDIGELKQVRDLHHLARCVEHMYRRGDHPGQMHPLDEPNGPPDERIRMGHRFHCAIYRVLFAGAVLTPAYLEPLFLAPVQGPPGFLHRLTSLRVDEAQDLDGLLHEDIEYLEWFSVYNLEAGQEKWEPPFVGLARWLLDDIESTFTKVEPSEFSGLGLAAEELGRLQEVTFFLAAYEHTMDKLFNRDRSTHGDRDVKRAPPPFPGRARKASVAMLGIFRPEEVSMPERVEDSSSCYLINEPLLSKEQQTPASQNRYIPDCVSPWTVDMQWVLQIIHKQSGRPNLRNGRRSPPPALRFLDYTLAEFFKARFDDGLFDEESPYYRLMEYECGFLKDPDLFGDSSITLSTWLFAENEAPTLGYRLLWC